MLTGLALGLVALFRVAVNVHLSHQRSLWLGLIRLAQLAKQPRRAPGHLAPVVSQISTPAPSPSALFRQNPEMDRALAEQLGLPLRRSSGVYVAIALPTWDEIRRSLKAPHMDAGSLARLQNERRQLLDEFAVP